MPITTLSEQLGEAVGCICREREKPHLIALYADDGLLVHRGSVLWIPPGVDAIDWLTARRDKRATQQR